jgi:hypothetical protein
LYFYTGNSGYYDTSTHVEPTYASSQGFLDALKKTCNISAETGWTINYMPVDTFDYRIAYYGAWANNTAAGVQWFATPSGVTVPQTQWPSLWGGSQISIWLRDRITGGLAMAPWEALGAQVHWISYVVSTMLP